MSLEPRGLNAADAVPTKLIDAVLKRYGFVRTAQPVLVPESVLNENYRVETTAGALFVRVHKANRTAERLQVEHEVIRWAAAHGIPVNEPLADLEARTLHAIDGRFLALFPWIEGRRLLRGAIRAEEAAALGEMLGRLHAALAHYDGTPLASGKVGSGWDTEQSAAALSRVDDLIRYYPAAGEAQLRIQTGLRRQLALLESGAARPRSDFDLLRVQPCHGDFHERNLLWASDGSVLAVVDWEMVSLLPSAFELLRFLTFCHLLEQPLLEASLTAYCKQASLHPGDCSSAVEMWWQSLLHDTWVYTAHFVQGARNVAQFFAESADHVARFSDPAFRLWLAAELRRFTL